MAEMSMNQFIEGLFEFLRETSNTKKIELIFHTNQNEAKAALDKIFRGVYELMELKKQLKYSKPELDHLKVLFTHHMMSGWKIEIVQ